MLAAAWTLSLPCSDLFQGSCLLGDPGSSSPQGTIFNVVTGCHNLGWGEGQVCYWCLAGRGQGCYEHHAVGRTGCSTLIQPHAARVPPTSSSAPPRLQAGRSGRSLPPQPFASTVSPAGVPSLLPPTSLNLRSLHPLSLWGLSSAARTRPSGPSQKPSLTTWYPDVSLHLISSWRLWPS